MCLEFRKSIVWEQTFHHFIYDTKIFYMKDIIFFFIFMQQLPICNRTSQLRRGIGYGPKKISRDEGSPSIILCTPVKFAKSNFNVK